MAPRQLSLVQKLEIVAKFQSGWSTRAICNHINADTDVVTMAQVRRYIKQYHNGYFNPELAAYGLESSPAQCIDETNKAALIAMCSEVVSNNDRLADCIFTGRCSIRIPTSSTGDQQIPESDTPAPVVVHVWGTISRQGDMQYIIFDGSLHQSFYIESMLQRHVLPTVRSRSPDSTHRFVHNNDAVSRSKAASNFMLDNGINCWQWPAESGHLNPTRKLWKQLKTCVTRQQPQTKDDLVDCIKSFFDNDVTLFLQNKLIDDVMKSMLTASLLSSSRPVFFVAPKPLLTVDHAPLHADMTDDITEERW